jgi:hypothetical protein
MKKSCFSKLVFSLIVMLFAAAGSVRAQQALLQDDTQIVSTAPTTNYGTAITASVNATSTTLLKFDIADMLPAGVTASQVSKARLIVWTGAVNSPGTFNLYGVTSSWSEGAVTYATRPSIGSTSYGVGTIAAVNEFVEVPCTALVQAWITNPSSNFGIALKPIGKLDFAIDTKDSTTHSHQPILQIDLTGPAGATGAQGPAGPQGATGPAGPAGPQGPAGTIALPYIGIGTRNGGAVFTVQNTGTDNGTNTPDGIAVFGGTSGDGGFVNGGNGIVATGGNSTSLGADNNYGGTGVVGYGGNGATGSTYSNGGNGGSFTGGAATGTAFGGIGVLAFAGPPNGRAIVASVGTADEGSAGDFEGNVYVGGELDKTSGAFKIDHPLDPENKFLMHSFVESPDMMNVYNGNVVTDGTGYATIAMPEYFEALNRDFRYQLTVIGPQFAQAIVSSEIVANHFTIRTDHPGVKVSWQVTGIRQDAWANAHRIGNEVEKSATEKGKYLHPELFGHPQSDSIAATFLHGTSAAARTQP